MKRLFLIGVVGLALVGCATKPVTLSDRKALPTERMVAFASKNANNNSKIIVTRDTGLTGGGCYYGFWVDGVLAARMGTKETAVFYIPSGERILRAGRDPFGKGLCAADSDNWTQIETHVDESTEKRYRMSLDANGRPSIQRES